MLLQFVCIHCKDQTMAQTRAPSRWRNICGRSSFKIRVSGRTIAEIIDIRMERIFGMPSGKGMWIDDQCKVALVQPKLNTLQKFRAGPITAPGPVESGWRLFREHITAEQLWQKSITNPTEWDNRNQKHYPQLAELAYKSRKQALWTNRWDTAAGRLGNAAEGKLSGISGGKGVLKSWMSFYGEHRPAKTGELMSPHQDGISWTALISEYTQSGQGRKALRVYAKMISDGVNLRSHACVAALKACGGLKDLRSAKKIHADVVERGFESDVYVGTMLIDVYAKCGSLVHARSVFERIPHRDVVSWNAMISGYTRVENGTEALTLYARMQQEGVVPDHRTFVAVLKACCSLVALDERIEADRKHVNLEQVRTIHSQVVKSGCGSDVYVGNMLVDVYAKCGSLVDARRVFDEMPHRDLVSWNSMIIGYAQMEEGEEALKLYGELQKEGLFPDNRTFVAALKACSALAGVEGNEVGEECRKKRSLEEAKAIHLQVVNSGSETAVFVGTMLVDVYAKCGNLMDARQVFEKMPHHDVVSWNAMILGYSQMEKGEEALQLYARMQQEGVLPNDRTFVAALKACSSLTVLEAGYQADAMKTRLLKLVRAIHFQAVRSGAEATVFVGTMLVDAYAKCGSLADARHVFDKMPHRDVFTWNAMILGYAEMEEFKNALECYAWMQQEGGVPDSRTFVAALKACSGLAALEVWTGGDGKRVKKQSLEQVMAIHKQVVKSGSEAVLMVGNILVDAYAKCGSLVSARCVFEKMPRRDVVSWTTMILGYAQMEEGEEAFQLYTQMQQEGVVPDTRAFVGALKACVSTAGLQRGKEIHAQISKTGLDATDSFVTSSLIDMYGKCGSMGDAQEVFDSLPRRDIVTWSALISGYADQGESDLVFDLVERMRHDGLKPNSITFLSVLTVCSHVGLVDKGQKYFEVMTREYGISPSLDHYTCLIDLLSRAGHIDKAMDIVKTMPYQADGAVWQTVLGACRKWRKVELGRQAFELAIGLDKHDAAAYVLMSNIYSAAHMLVDAKEIQARRMKAHAWKKPGQSWWTDMGGIVHTFFAGDKGHPESQGIHAKVRELIGKMKHHGYVPHLDSVLRHIPDDEKEDSLCGHSEKLAIAHALLKTPEGMTIRVTKNLRVCEDCHRAIALISKIELRTIVCRDASRFHVFEDGKCSCGDYW